MAIKRSQGGEERMKILYTNFHEDDGGGHTTYLLALARGLSGRHQVHVACPPGSRLYRRMSDIPGVIVIAQPFPNGFRRLRERQPALRRLRELLRTRDFDVIHVNGSADHRLVLCALRNLARPPKLVLTKHNSKPVGGIGPWWRSRHTDQVIAVCESAAAMVADSAYRHSRIDVIGNGVDLEHYAPWPAHDALAQRRRWVGNDGDVLLIGSNAGTAPYKGWMDLVEALALLAPASRARVHVLLAGNLPGAAQLQRIAALGLLDQVHFAGLVEDVRPIVAAIDAGFVLSHAVETISFACREMMAMAKPVLVSNYAGLPENVEPGHDGWVVAPRTPHAVASVLEKMLDGREHLPAMGQAARRHAERDFGLAAFVDGTDAVYRRLLEQPRR